MAKFVVGDSSEIKQATNDDECCDTCTYRGGDGTCNMFMVEVEDGEVCRDWETNKD